MMPTFRGAVALVACLLCLTTSNFAKPLTQSIELSSSDRLYYFGQTEVQDFELVSPQINSRARRDMSSKPSELLVSFEAFGQAFTLSLKPAEGLFDAGTLVHAVGKDGKTVLSQPSESCLYEGSSIKHEDSTVSASNCGNKLEASVTTKKASFVLVPLKSEHVEKDGPTHIIFRRSANVKACDLNADRPFTSTQTRRKRSTNDPIYVEASVVADDLMYKTYGNNTDDYLITILNQVAGLLKDSSLDVQVNLKISNIKIVKSPQADLSLSEDLDKSLKSFCSWQKGSKSDISILVTRRDLVSAGSHEVTGKTVDVGVACDPERRCLISQDHGPSGLIFTLAHEIGHSLGMYHDGGLSDCLNKKNIMATVNSGGPEAFHWSDCSNSDLLTFLDLPESKCLKDKPKALPTYTPSSVPMPGFYYNATEQCAMSFNAMSTVASEVLNNKEICQALVCKTGKGVPESTNVPPLDGTRCGTKRDICISGQCMKVFSTLDCDGGECIPFWLESSFVCNAATCIQSRTVLCVEQHDDGTTRRVTDLSRCPSEVPPSTGVCSSDPCRFQYIAGAYGSCSVTCGVGIQTRSVLCQDTSNEVTEIVNDDLCTSEKPLTTLECNTGILCPTISFSFFVGVFGACSATCGTGSQTRDVFCQDNQGSNVDDLVCTNLNLVRPSETQACNDGDCPTVGLRYIPGPLSECSVTCGTGIRTRMIYCVNGANFVVQNAECEAVNLELPSTQTTCTQQACPVETYTAVRGQYGSCSVTCGTGSESRVVICLNQNTVEVAIQNCIDFGLTDLETVRDCTLSACPPEFFFQPSPYGECSVTCGSGVRVRTVFCLNQQNEVVDAVNCINLGLNPPPSAISCELQECATYIYRFEPFGPCNEECGDGLQVRTVFCTNNDTNEIVADSECPDEKPPSTRPCNLMPCNVILQFVTGSYSNCNCSGIQTRVVFCISTAGSTLGSVPFQDCLDAGLLPQASSQQCTPPSSCVQPDPVWEVAPWGACSVTCGTGIQDRLVYCIEAPNSPNIVDASRCNAQDIPDTVQPCNTEVNCPADNIWLAYGWETCSVTCGGGFEIRQVLCFSLGASIVQVNDTLCDANVKPIDVRACNPDPCTASWTTSAWTACSVTCGVGTESRGIMCRATKDPSSNIVEEEECISEDRPSDSRPCLLSICPSPFGCNTTSVLEGGVEYTESSPGFSEGQNYPNDLDCEKAFAVMGENPNERRNVAPRPGYYIQLTFNAFDLESSPNCNYDYLEISDIAYNISERLCGNSYDLPLVWTSLGPHISMYFHTDASVNRPGYSVIYQALEKQEPARYEVTNWSECSVTCGEGVEMRNVVCYRGNETVEESECSGLERPISSQPCMEDECVAPSACSGNLLRTEDNSIVLSPNFPGNYPNNVSCYNTIQAPPGMVVQITITYFNLRASAECTDKVLINDVNSKGDSLVLCGVQSPGVIFTSITNEVIIQFVSSDQGDFGVTGNGYSLQANFVNEQGSPCGLEIRTSGQAVYSPNYPLDYNSGENCLTVIRNNEGCIQLQFLDIDLPPYSESGQCSDFVQVVDLTLVNVNTGPICGDEIPSVFYSATSLLTVRFFSDDSSNATGGYNAVVRFVECTAGLWITGPYGACSATCGEAFRSRTVACQDPRTMEELNADMCPPERPDEMLACETEECPSCDVQITESGQQISSPNYPQNYDSDQSCVIDISNPDGCVTINFLQFDVQPAINSQVCNTDSVKIDDGVSTFRYCGSRSPFVYRSASDTVQLQFISDDIVESSGYVAYVTFNPCPINVYVTGNWSECSVTCGSGIRTRDVQCMDLLNNVPATDSLCGDRPPSEEPCLAEVECPACDVLINETGQFTTSPGFPDDYAENLDCVYTFEFSTAQCLRLILLEVYLGGPGDEGLCDEDYIEISNGVLQPAVRYCPESARSITWYSMTGDARVRFITDDEEAAQGFNIYNILGDCPLYDFEVGEFGECSRPCGGGVRTREVQCILLVDSTTVDEDLCLNQRPLESMPCNMEPCPVCDEAVSPGVDLITSPGFSRVPPSYDNFLDCTYNITNPDGCILLTLLSLDLEMCTDCACDSLTIIESGEAALPPLCGSQPVTRWESETSNVLLEFETNSAGTFAGFNIHVAYVPCKDVFFFTGEYSECDVSCGGGVQTREVYCKSRSTNEEVPELMCTNDKPPTMRTCGEDPCPFCDEDITSPSFITSPNFPESYPVSINCNYNITAPAGLCLSLLILTLSLEEPAGDPAQCKDFVEVTDENAPILRRKYCGLIGATSIEWESRSGSVNVEFYSDEENTAGGFRINVNFIACPAFGYVANEFGSCSKPCGDGVQRRDVYCMQFATGQAVSDSSCQDERPVDSRPCNTEPCPECDTLVINPRENLFSINFPQPYFEYSCNYIYTNPGGCVELLFIQFEMPQPNADGICDTDYLLVEDLTERPFSYRICGNAIPASVVSRGQTLNVTLVTDGNPATFGEGFQIYNLFMDTCPQVGYMAGEWDECDRQCGGGTRRRSVDCIDLTTGIVVVDDMCLDRRPTDMELCNSDPCPSCDQVIDSFPYGLQNPNYPNSFEPYRTCLYNVTSSRCVRVNFLNFNFPPANMDTMRCGETFLQVRDLGADYLMRTFCGEGAEIDPSTLLYAWESRTGQVMITLNSGEVIPEGSIFNLYITETNCPEYGFVAGNFSECSTTCGNDGVLTRNVECQRLATGLPAASEDSCTDPKPADVVPCRPQAPCPSCDVLVEEANTLVMSPPRDGTLTGDVQCEVRISLDSEAPCVLITALQLTLNDPDSNGTCVLSSLTFSDGTYNYSQQICGSPMRLPVSFRALTNSASVYFNSANYLSSPDIYSLYILETECPSLMYETGNFSQCSASCGGGIRTRDVICKRLDLDEEVPYAACQDVPPPSEEPCNVEECPMECDNVLTSNIPMASLTSPGRPTYVTEANCVNRIVGFDCISINVTSIDIEAGSGVCDRDYLEISDASFPELTVRLCGGTVPATSWRSKSGVVVTTFISDNVDTMQNGYSLDYAFETQCPDGTYSLTGFGACSATCGGGTRVANDVICSSAAGCPGLPPSLVESCNTDPCPEYYFYQGPYSDCSVTCGDGMETRVVECRRVDNDTMVEDVLCNGTIPDTTRPCNDGSCPINTLQCDNVLASSDPLAVLISPGQPTYMTDANCLNRIVGLSGCISINVTSIDIEAGSGVCDRDYLEISDASFPELTVRLCGGTVPTTRWRSKSTVVTTTFVSDNVDTMQNGYSLDYAFETQCPDGTYSLTGFGACSATCGGGTRVANDVICSSAAGCPGLPPSLVESCNTDPCPEYYFYQGSYSDCSVTCGDGMETRVVECRRVDNDTMVEDVLCNGTIPDTTRPCNDGSCPITTLQCDNVLTSSDPLAVLISPGQPTYMTDANCVNRIVGLSGCISINVTSIDIEATDGCEKDYLEISDASFTELTVRLCGGTVPTTRWRSKSSVVATTFVSDNVDTMQNGYSLDYAFETQCPDGTYSLTGFGACSATCGGGTRVANDVICSSAAGCPGLPPSLVESCNTDPCPEYYFYQGPYSDCSVTCGDGMETRVVECRRVDNDTMVENVLCNGTIPDTTRPCNNGSCPNDVLVVSEPFRTINVSLGESGTFTSPNYPMNYPDNLNSGLILIIPAGSLLMVVVDELNLVFDTPCSAGDSLTFASGGQELAVCSANVGIPFTWYSMEGATEITVTFTTSATNSDTGFTCSWSVIQQ